MYKYLLPICLSALCVFTAMGQKPDTTVSAKKSTSDTLISTRQDTDVARSFKPKKKKEPVFHPDSTHSPHTAIIHSLLIPGWGQVYNHKWWKVPVIYGSLALLVDAVIFNNTYYSEFLAISKYREHGQIPSPTQAYYADYMAYANQEDQAIFDATNSYRRDRDLSILGILGVWGINVIDAYIDAKFMHSYSVDNNLSMKVTPGVINQPFYAFTSSGSYIPAIKITFTLR